MPSGPRDRANSHDRRRPQQMAESSHRRPPRSHRSLPRQPLPRRQPLRHPRQARYHTAKGHPTRASSAGSLGCAGLSWRGCFGRYPIFTSVGTEFGGNGAHRCDLEFVRIPERLLLENSCDWRFVAHRLFAWGPSSGLLWLLFIYVQHTDYRVTTTSPVYQYFG